MGSTMTPTLSPFGDRCKVRGSTACLYSGIVSYMGRRVLTGNATRFLAGELAAQKARNGWSLDDIEARTGVPRSGGVPPYMLTRRSRAGCRFGLNPPECQLVLRFEKAAAH